MHDLDKAIRAAMMTAHRYARGGYAGQGFVDDAPDSVLMQDKLDAPNQWLQFGGQDMQAPPAGLPIGQAVGTSLGYHGLEGLAGGAELTQQAIQEGRSPDMSNPETAEKVLNAAGLAQLGGFGVPARAGETVLGSGPVIRQAVEMAAQPRELSPLGFYSHGAETAAGLQQAKGAPDQMAAMLQRYGVKPDEMYATGFANESATAAARSKIEAEFAPRVAESQRAMEGLEPGTPEFKAAERQFKNISSTMRAEMDRALVLGDEWSARPSVTREEIAAHFKERMPQIEETVLGGRGKPEMDEAAKQKWIEDQAAERAYNSGDIERIRDWRDASNEVRDWHLDEATSYFNERMATSPDFASQFQTVGEGGATKFQQYTLPGGENYREVLLKLPERGTTTGGIAQKLFGRNMDELSIEEGRAVAEEMRRLGPSTQSDFTSSHWQDPNVLAHLRLADRTGPNGEKILHVEEIQSDWGQQGKKAGFITPETTKQIESINQKITDLMGQRDNLKDQLKDLQPKISARSGYGEPLEYPEHYTVDLEVGIRKKIKNIENEVNDLRKSRPSPGLPSAPYVTNTQAWTDLALKRALREAAEGGYDKLVWTPGTEQAKRYSLSNQVDRLQYVKNDDGTYAVIPYKNNRPLHQIERNNIPDKELESLFGRDVAEKMRAYEGDVDGNARSLSGQNLEVGGEGMKGYYDKIVPNQLSKLVKKLDPEAKVGRETLETRAMTPEQLMNERTIPDQNQVDFHSLTITPKMREAIMKGQTAYAKGGTIPFGPEAAQRAVQIAKQQAGRR